MVINEKALLKVIEQMANGVFVCDREGKILMFNSAAKRLLPHPPEDIKDWLHRIKKSDRVTPFSPNELPTYKAINGEESRNVEMYVEPSDGAPGVSISLDSFPLWDSTNSLVVGGVSVFHDITENLRVLDVIQDISKRFSHLQVLLESSLKKPQTI